MGDDNYCGLPMPNCVVENKADVEIALGKEVLIVFEVWRRRFLHLVKFLLFLKAYKCKNDFTVFCLLVLFTGMGVQLPGVHRLASTNGNV